MAYASEGWLVHLKFRIVLYMIAKHWGLGSKLTLECMLLGRDNYVISNLVLPYGHNKLRCGRQVDVYYAMLRLLINLSAMRQQYADCNSTTDLLY